MKVLALALLFGCGSRAASGPAWPRLHTTATDGGESLAPRQSNPVAAAAAVADDDPLADVLAPIAPVTAAPKPVEPGATPAVKPAAPDEPVMLEEVIEIDE